MLERMIFRMYLIYLNLLYLGTLNYLRYKLLKENSLINLIYYNEIFFIRARTDDISAIIPYMEKEFSILKDLLPTDYEGIIIDAGAYIGSASIVLSRMFPNARILAIEPNEENFKILGNNTKNYANVFCFHGALRSSDSVNTKIYNRKTGLMGFTIAEYPNDQPQAEFFYEVQSFTITKLTNNVVPGLIKLDIEGAEAELFIEDKVLPNIDYVFVELHDSIINECSDLFWKFSSNRHVIKDSGEKFLSIRKY